MRGRSSQGKARNTSLFSLLQQHSQNPQNEYTFKARNTLLSPQGGNAFSGNEENQCRSNIFTELENGSGKKQGLFGRIVQRMQNRAPLHEVQEEAESQEANLPFDQVKLPMKPYRFCFPHSRTPQAENSEESEGKYGSDMEVGSLAQQSKVEKVIIPSVEPIQSNNEKISVDFSFDDISQHLQSVKQASGELQPQPKEEALPQVELVQSPVQQFLKAKESLPNSPKVVINSLLPKPATRSRREESFEIAGTRRVESRVYEQEEKVSGRDIKIDFDLDLDFI